MIHIISGTLNLLQGKPRASGDDPIRSGRALSLDV